MTSSVVDRLRESGFVVVPGQFLSFVDDLKLLQRQLPSPSYLGGILTGDAVLLNQTLLSDLSSLLGPGFLVARSHLGNAATNLLATTRDRTVLFGDDTIDCQLSPFSVTLFVPLQDTVVRCRQTDISLKVGDGFLLDSRVAAEMAPSPAIPGLLMVFVRAWFREAISNPNVAPFELSSIDYFRLSPDLRARLQWRFDRYFSQRPRLLMYQMANRLPFIIGAPLKRKLRRWASSY